MINIVTIDFDIIMSPSINFYNDIISEGDGLDDSTYPIVNTFPADLNRYEYLTRFICAARESAKDNIYFISTHQNIEKYLKNLPKDEEYHLYNIDHHHDVGYDINFKIPLMSAGVGDWVKYCKDNKYIQKYTWIKNDNSNEIENGAKKYIDEIIDINKINLMKLVKETDILIICGSLEWVPPIYHPLFSTWQTILEEIDHKDYIVDNF